MSLRMFQEDGGRLSSAEQAVVVGVLAHLRPEVAIEVGAAGGDRILGLQTHAERAHAVPPTGDPEATLAVLLAELEGEGRTVGFVLVRSRALAAQLRSVLETLLSSPALAQAVILIDEAADEEVRRGLDAFPFSAWPKVAEVELDWIPGRLYAGEERRNQLGGGLALVALDATRLAYRSPPVYPQRYRPAAAMLAQAREVILAREQSPPTGEALRAGGAAHARIAELEAELGALASASARADRLEVELAIARRRITALEAEIEPARRRVAETEEELATAWNRITGAERALTDITGSASWRMTEPLRTVKRHVRRPKS